MTSIFFEFGLANQVELSEGNVKLIMTSRNAFNYKTGADNSFWENLGKADRMWSIDGGPISTDDLTKLKTLVDSSAQVHFRAEITSNADVHVLILHCEVNRSCESASPAATTKLMYISAVVREAV